MVAVVCGLAPVEAVAAVVAAVAVDAVVLVVTAGFLWTVEDADVVVVEPEPPPNLKTTRRGT